MYHHQGRPEALFRHIYGNLEGILVTFSGRQARLRNPEAPRNKLDFVTQDYFTYPRQERKAAEYLIRLSEAGRDAYVGTHLYAKKGSRLASNATEEVVALWMDEDEGCYPDVGPEPTAIVRSSEDRRHLYWRLTRPVPAMWAQEMNRRLATWAGADVGAANLARVLRAPGTKNYKRHPEVHLVAFAETPVGCWEPEVLDRAIPPAPVQSVPSAPVQSYDGPEEEIEDYLDRVEAFGECQDGLGTKYAIRCPWVKDHTGGDPSGTYVGKRDGGGLWFHCNHAHCHGRGWREFTKALFWNRDTEINLPGYTGNALKVEVRYDR